MGSQSRFSTEPLTQTIKDQPVVFKDSGFKGPEQPVPHKEASQTCSLTDLAKQHIGQYIFFLQGLGKVTGPNLA